jgi:hypothetical protein
MKRLIYSLNGVGEWQALVYLEQQKLYVRL